MDLCCLCWWAQAEMLKMHRTADFRKIHLHASAIPLKCQNALEKFEGKNLKLKFLISISKNHGYSQVQSDT